MKQQLEADVRQAMRDRDKERRDRLRYLLAQMQNAEIEKREPLTEQEELQLVRTQIKSGQDAIEQFRAGGRDDLVAENEAQIALYETYLPQQMSDEELAAFVQEGVEETGAEGQKDMGKVMGVLTKRTDDRVDGRRLSVAVREALSG